MRHDRPGKPFFIAAALHLLAIALLLTGYLVSPREQPREPSQTLQVVNLPAVQQQRQAEPEPQAERQRMEIPEFEFQEVEIPRGEARERPRQEPPPEPEPQPEPQPQPEPAPRPDPEPPPERVSIAEFRAQHGTPETPQPRPRPQQQPAPRVEAPRIDRSPIEQLRQEMDRNVELPQTDLSRISQASSADRNVLRDYLASLRAALERNWEKPSGANTGMSARVSFSISPDGRITNARVVESSGDEAFDRSVLEAFTRLGTFRPTPDGEGLTPRITFRVEN